MLWSLAWCWRRSLPCSLSCSGELAALTGQAGAHGPALPVLLADRSAFAGAAGGWAGMVTRENEKGDAMREAPTDRRSRPPPILYARFVPS